MDLFRNCDLEQIPPVFLGTQQFSSYDSVVTAQSTFKYFMNIASVLFNRLRVANMNQQRWHDLVEIYKPQLIGHKSAGWNRTDHQECQEKFLGIPLSMKRKSVKT